MATTDPTYASVEAREERLARDALVEDHAEAPKVHRQAIAVAWWRDITHMRGELGSAWSHRTWAIPSSPYAQHTGQHTVTPRPTPRASVIHRTTLLSDTSYHTSFRDIVPYCFQTTHSAEHTQAG